MLHTTANEIYKFLCGRNSNKKLYTYVILSMVDNNVVLCSFPVFPDIARIYLEILRLEKEKEEAKIKERGKLS